jgi:hypothetical protein
MAKRDKQALYQTNPEQLKSTGRPTELTDIDMAVIRAEVLGTDKDRSSSHLKKIAAKHNLSLPLFVKYRKRAVKDKKAENKRYRKSILHGLPLALLVPALSATLQTLLLCILKAPGKAIEHATVSTGFERLLDPYPSARNVLEDIYAFVRADRTTIPRPVYDVFFLFLISQVSRYSLSI